MKTSVVQEVTTTVGGLTPIHKEGKGNPYYKRDDLFVPYKDLPINGGKVRQAISLLSLNKDHIINECNNTVATASSVESPQGIIIGRVAKELGMKSILAVGGGTDVDKLLKKHRLLRASQSVGTEIRAVNKLGYNTVLYSKLQEMQKTEKFFMALFGINADANFKSILGTTMAQVDNLPLDNLHRIIVPVGSALMYSAILMRLQELGWLKDKKNQCIGIQIANVSRKKTIKDLLSRRFYMQKVRFKEILDDRYSYHTYIKQSMLGLGVSLDPIYEAKAHSYAIEHNLFDDNTLYWVVGNSMTVREAFDK